MSQLSSKLTFPYLSTMHGEPGGKGVLPPPKGFREGHLTPLPLTTELLFYKVQICSPPSNFSLEMAPMNVVNTITALEEKLPLVKSVELVEKLQDAVILEPFGIKLKLVLKNPPALRQSRRSPSCCEALRRNFEATDSNTTAMMVNDPIVTCDVERTVSTLRDLNTPKRNNLSEDNILITQWTSKTEF